MSETATRIATGLVLAPLAVAALIAGGWFWAGTVLFVALISLLEFFDIMRARGYHPHRGIGVAVCAVLIIVAHIAGLELAAGILTAGILGILVTQLSKPAMGKAIPNISVSIAGVLYVGWLISHGIYLRAIGGEARPDLGIFAVLFVLAATFSADTGAYFVGRKFGRHKVAPTISPKKSWEGLGGGVVSAAASGPLLRWIWEHWGDPVPFDWGLLAALGFALGLVGFAGDLVESLLKRDADVKDSGAILPGHGGFLDRIDGVLFTIPFTYYVLSFVDVGAHFGPPHP